MNRRIVLVTALTAGVLVLAGVALLLSSRSARTTSMMLFASPTLPHVPVDSSSSPKFPSMCTLDPFPMNFRVPCQKGMWAIFSYSINNIERTGFGRWDSSPKERIVVPKVDLTIVAYHKNTPVKARAILRSILSRDGTELNIVPPGTNLILAPGTYVITVEKGDLFGALGPLDLEAGRVQLDIHMMKTVRVRGLVRDASTDAPIPGARVVLSRAFPSLWHHEDDTDAHGKFVLDRVVPGQYVVSVRAPGHVPILDMGYWISEHPGLVLLELQKGHTIKGIVVDAQGRRVSGAFVRLRGIAEDTTIVAPGSGAWTSTTGDDGSFEITGVPTGEMVLTVSTSQGEYAHKALGWVARDLRDLSITVTGAHTLHGRVLDGRDLPVEAFVKATSPTDPMFSHYATCRNDGTFLIPGAPELITLEVSAPGYTPVSRTVRSSGSEALIHLARARRTLSVRFVDPNGVPVKGSMELTSHRPWYSRNAVTKDSGEIILHDMPALPLRFTFVPEEKFPTLQGTIPATTDSTTLTVPFGASITGFVRDIQTKEGLQAEVHIVDSLGNHHVVYTKEGELNTPPLSPGKAKISIISNGYPPFLTELDVPEARYAGESVPGDHVWELSLARTVRGTVRNEHGLPISGVMVGWDWGQTVTRHDGTFQIRNVIRQGVKLWAWHPSYGWAVVDIPAEDYDETSVDITLGHDTGIVSTESIPERTILRVGRIDSDMGLSPRLVMSGYEVVPVVVDGIIPRYLLIRSNAHGSKTK